jgi:hypothetical protein
MKRALVAVVMTVLAAALIAGQQNSKRAPQGGGAEEEIKQLEREWLVESYRKTDLSAYDRIVADDFTITHSNGRVLNKAEKREDISASHISDPASPSYFFIEEARVRVYGDAAVSVGSIAEKHGRVRFTNTYVRRDGRWQVVASQLNRVRQP